jgi:hypothetical protein
MNKGFYYCYKVRDHTLKAMAEMCADKFIFWSFSTYCRLRSLAVCRLTLFNARRGGEPARLTLAEWNDAETDAWVDPTIVETITDPLEKELIGSFKLCYQAGKCHSMFNLLR